jgi:hypothetical protein
VTPVSMDVISVVGLTTKFAPGLVTGDDRAHYMGERQQKQPHCLSSQVLELCAFCE